MTDLFWLLLPTKDRRKVVNLQQDLEQQLRTWEMRKRPKDP